MAPLDQPPVYGEHSRSPADAPSCVAMVQPAWAEWLSINGKSDKMPVPATTET
ncbi:hypothetical protein H4Q26_016229 [Puccinia striiformis f. sp. tritici PST-130]|nr:hypothetical protein H4Q26_016229 [Puccinia striiformis f. sp. tritici PST-130]